MSKRKQTFDYDFQYVIDIEARDGYAKKFKTGDLRKAKKFFRKTFGTTYDRGSSYYVNQFGDVMGSIYVEPYDRKLSLKAEQQITGYDPFEPFEGIIN